MGGDADLRVAERLALGNENLRAYQIDARYHLRDRVLYLNAGIHLDKVMVAVLVHKEFQRSGVDIAYVPAIFTASSHSACAPPVRRRKQG